MYDTAAQRLQLRHGLYRERFGGGNDRIADNNLLTLGVTTRLLEPRQRCRGRRFGVAQRLRFPTRG